MGIIAMLTMQTKHDRMIQQDTRKLRRPKSFSWPYKLLQSAAMFASNQGMNQIRFALIDG
jgi:hypothetical protein